MVSLTVNFPLFFYAFPKKKERKGEERKEERKSKGRKNKERKKRDTVMWC